MSDNEQTADVQPIAFDPVCGWLKLYHKRGVQVTIPLRGPIDTFAAQVDMLFDAGWMLTAPGLEEGEEKEEIGWVLHALHEKDGETTPIAVLYAANEALTWPILKIYLNKQADVDAFEFASKMKLSSIPEYVGNDRPQRGAGAKTDKFIIKVPKPFGVVFKKNPKHDDTEQGKMKPARLFVRWADQKPATETKIADGTAGLKVIAEWEEWFQRDDSTVAALNKKMHEELPVLEPIAKRAVWTLIKEKAAQAGWQFSEGTKTFMVPNNREFAETGF